MISATTRLRLLLGLARLAIFCADGCRSGAASVGRRIAPQRRWRGMEIPEVGGGVRVPSGERWLEGWSVASEAPAHAAVLLLHGLGDRLPYWRGVQQRLARGGVRSLVYGYAGYGQSDGPFTPENVRRDVLSAYGWLREHSPPDTPLFVLGFSLGSGIAAESLRTLHPAPAGLVLCEAFTTLRQAAGRIVRAVPSLATLLPDVWKTVEFVRELTIPLLIVHSSGDRLFPVAMAEEIFAAASAKNTRAELAVFAGYAHNAPYLNVPEDYWATILDFLAKDRKSTDRSPA